MWNVEWIGAVRRAAPHARPREGDADGPDERAERAKGTRQVQDAQADPQREHQEAHRRVRVHVTLVSRHSIQMPILISTSRHSIDSYFPSSALLSPSTRTLYIFFNSDFLGLWDPLHFSALVNTVHLFNWISAFHCVTCRYFSLTYYVGPAFDFSRVACIYLLLFFSIYDSASRRFTLLMFSKPEFRSIQVLSAFFPLSAVTMLSIYSIFPVEYYLFTRIPLVSNSYSSNRFQLIYFSAYQNGSLCVQQSFEFKNAVRIEISSLPIQRCLYFSIHLFFPHSLLCFSLFNEFILSFLKHIKTQIPSTSYPYHHF